MRFRKVHSEFISPENCKNAGDCRVTRHLPSHLPSHPTKQSRFHANLTERVLQCLPQWTSTPQYWMLATARQWISTPRHWMLPTARQWMSIPPYWMSSQWTSTEPCWMPSSISWQLLTSPSSEIHSNLLLPPSRESWHEGSKAREEAVGGAIAHKYLGTESRDPVTSYRFCNVHRMLEG